ncbi:MAG: hypothetical protein NTX53_19205, partial [candidate division WOR-3 bacterium]|nr:hypothetical protein [candidate division WOR-3 bacterium]
AERCPTKCEVRPEKNPNSEALTWGIHAGFRFNGLCLESPRFGAEAIAKVAMSTPQTRFLLSTGRLDMPHGGQGLFSVKQPNVAVVDLALPYSTGFPSDGQPIGLASRLADAAVPLTPFLRGITAPFTAHSNVQDPTLFGTGDVKVGLAATQSRDVILGDLARDYLRKGTISPETRLPSMLPEASLVGLSFSSTQPWSQMPRFMDDITSGRKLSGPIAIVAQDPVKSYAFDRMLQNKGISTVVTPSLDRDQMEHLGSIMRPERIVGFDQKLDDNWRKIVPFFPPGGGGGGASVGSSNPVTIDRNTFSFPGSDGRTVTLPLPRSFTTPTDWNQFKSWMPKGSVGGVDTKQLEWTFVDKGVWPVMTMFTLGYEPIPAAKTDQEERK